MRTKGSIFEDNGRVALSIAMKDVTNPTGPSANNLITLNRYRVEYRRTDGRNTPGEDVPYAFEGAMGVTITDQATSVVFTLVRAQAKLEKPLVTLVGTNGGALDHLDHRRRDLLRQGPDRPRRDRDRFHEHQLRRLGGCPVARCSHDERTTTHYFCCLRWRACGAMTACTSEPDIPKATGPSELGLVAPGAGLARRAQHRWPLDVADHRDRAWAQQ